MKFILLLMVIPLCAVVQAQENKKQVDSKIDQVTVFLNGAQVTRKATVTLTKGANDLVFHDVSTSVNPQSIQVFADNDLTVLSVNHQINYIEEPAKREEFTKLEGQLKTLQDKVNSETATLQVFQQEENMLVKNQAIGGNNMVLKVADLKEAMDFQRTRMTEVKNKQLEINRKITDDNKEIAKIKQQLGELAGKNIRAMGEIVINAVAAEAGPTKVVLNYVVNNVGWSPSYDLRVTDISKPIYLKYKANIVQNSGEDWNKVKLSLSSGNPNESGTMPELQVWNLDIQPVRPIYKELENKEYMMSKEMMPANKEIMIRGTNAPKAAYIPNVIQSTGQTTFQFDIEQPYTIPSDSKQHTVDVKEQLINASYEYFCIPKLDKDAFLTARITGWEGMNLLTGEANLYFEGTYLGKAALDTRNAKDTLDISLGRDKNIAVNRTKSKDFKRNQTLGSSKIEERSWEISIRNKKTQPINITVLDQFPTSVNKEIIVEKGDYKDAALDEVTNQLTWRLTVDPAKEKKVSFNYSVKSPKGSTIILE